MTSDESLYYATHSVETDPADLRECLDALPKRPDRLLDAIGGLVLHTAFVVPLGLVCPPESGDDVHSRRVPAMLRRILAREPGSLATRRPPEKRFIGVCSHSPRVQRAPAPWRTGARTCRIRQLLRTGLP